MRSPSRLKVADDSDGQKGQQVAAVYYSYQTGLDFVSNQTGHGSKTFFDRLIDPISMINGYRGILPLRVCYSMHVLKQSYPLDTTSRSLRLISFEKLGLEISCAVMLQVYDHTIIGKNSQTR